MATTFSSSRQSGAVHAHPIHGILSAYPLALFSGALASDIAYANSANMQWANFSIWMIAGGLLMGALAVVAGIVDTLVGRRRRRGQTGPTRRGYLIHGVVTVGMLVLALINAFIHSRDAWTSVVPTGLILSAIVTVLAVVSSWQGFNLLARGDAR